MGGERRTECHVQGNQVLDSRVLLGGGRSGPHYVDEPLTGIAHIESVCALQHLVQPFSEAPGRANEVWGSVSDGALAPGDA